MNMKNITPKVILFHLKSNMGTVFLCFLFLLHTFFSFYGFENKHVFTWDQVDNAWAAKNIIVDQKFPLVGMVAKQNSGFYIGPLYYYFVAFFYLLTNLDPSASIYIAGVTSAITFFVLYFFIKKIFSESVALVSVFIYTVSSFIILAERVQWPVNFLAPISIIIFYVLYKIITGNEKYILWLALALGISWQLNFTSIFFFIITLCTLPFFPRTKKTLRFFILSLPLIIVFFIPNVIYDIFNKGTSSKHLSSYLNDYYHGFHATRVIQLAKDAFIEFAAIFDNFFIKSLRYIFLPVFLVLFLKDSILRKRLLLCYIVLLWFIIPWCVFSVYRGEISSYYFSITRPIALMILAFITTWIYQRKFIAAKISILLFWGIFTFINISQFFVPLYRPLSYYRKSVEAKINANQKVDFSPGNPESYIYYVYTEYAKNKNKTN